uniref:Myosin_tail_1 domain-containing protein n=1 Tax=Schistocephalus solidus TaxID=70667 RepID=A0A183TMF9_SCHSO
LEDKVRINDSEKEEIQNSARENLELVARKDAENAQLTERLQLAEAERMAAVKRNDEIRAELLYAMEQQQQEMDKLLRLKDRELEGLRSNLATQQNDSEKNAKRTANILQENTETLASLREELDNLRQNKKELDEKVSAQEMELQKLKKIEQEFESFRHQNLLKTPQNTPKGILKRPGSECKRRRVLLVSPARSPTPPPRAETADYDVIDLDSEPEPQSRPITPKIRRTPLVGGRMPLQTRASASP